MNWTLEVVVVPVSDVDRAKAFYAEKLDFNVDHDIKISDENRLVQRTPPGAARSSWGKGSSRTCRRARSRACSWWSMTSTRRGPSSWSEAWR
jgi:hypothetical protein